VTTIVNPQAIKSIADAGAKVVVTGSTLGDLALHFCNKYSVCIVMRDFVCVCVCVGGGGMGWVAHCVASCVNGHGLGGCFRDGIVQCGCAVARFHWVVGINPPPHWRSRAPPDPGDMIVAENGNQLTGYDFMQT
jgi:hypothetical protein